MAKNATARIVVVAGDETMDWNLARGHSRQGGGDAWNAEDCTRAYWQRGGAAMLGDLIEAVSEQLKTSGTTNWEVRQSGSPGKPVHPGDPGHHHSYAMWKLFKYSEQATLAKEKPVWRVDEFLGLDRCTPDPATVKQNDRRLKSDDAAHADVIVLDDANLGFRDDKRLWPRALDSRKQRPWIVVKMAQPVAQGALWHHLHKHFSDRLIVVMTINDLRLSEVQISRELSWERTAQDLAWEFIYNPRVNSLSQCAHVIVSFDTAGAILLSSSPKRKAPECKLVFEPTVVEGMWAQEHPGQMIGYTVCLTASLARQLMVAPEAPDLEEGVRVGLAAMRKLHLEGHGRRGAPVPEANLVFPFQMIAIELEQTGTQFAIAEVQDPVRFVAEPAPQPAPEDGFWTILQDRYTGTLDQVSERIVLDGVESALQGVPLGQFGKLLTVDRREIEAFRSMRTLIGEYCRAVRPKRPLSIAVFGAPGAGKSFGIVEVANSLKLGAPVEKREFNLSQFGSPEEILDALHQVRDVGLSGSIPLVFWDEFDTSLNQQPLGWLRYFLAPMQDGKFQQGQITHPIGRAIFIFAGGTSETMEAFDRGTGNTEFKAVKGPDFVSRLKGYVNILGPNSNANASDPYFLIRRAILLRSILQRDAPRLFQQGHLEIDSGVLRALLQTKRYKHGVRSMESIIAMSLLAGKRRFERSALPAEAQLDLHVEARDFLALLQKMELEGEFLELLAGAVHDVFCDDLRSRGYRHGPRNDDKLKTHASLRPYAELPEDEKEQNRGNVRDIASKLALAGYVMMPARSNDPPFNFPGADLEKLAEMEHDRWMRLKLQSGWLYSPTTDKKRKLHNALLPWRKLSAAERARLYTPYDSAVGSGVLPEAEKKKDRLLVRSIPRILSRVGYTAVRVTQDNNRASAKKGRGNDQNRSNGSSPPNRPGQAQRRNRKST